MVVSRLGDLHWTLDLLSHFHVQYLGLAIGSLSVAIAARAWWGAGAAMVVAMAAGWQVAPLWRAPAGEAEVGEPDARLVAVNVLSSNREHGEVIGWLLEQEADVLVVQEVNAVWAAALDTSLRGYRRIPTDTLRADNFGMAIYLSESWQAEEPVVHSTDLGLPWIEVVIHRGTVDLRVMGVHTIPPVRRSNYRSRNEQLLRAAEFVRGSSEPAVIAGDFNATIWSSAMRPILDEGRLRPACLGHGIIGSWHSRLLWTGGILIDQVLVDDRLSVQSHTVGPHVGSDHRGIVVDLRIR